MQEIVISNSRDIKKLKIIFSFPKEAENVICAKSFFRLALNK